MMQLRILLFGITRDILGGDAHDLSMSKNSTVGDLKAQLYLQFPKMKQLRSLLIAVNNEYADDDTNLSEKDEIALIPPVSGG